MSMDSRGGRWWSVSACKAWIVLALGLLSSTPLDAKIVEEQVAESVTIYRNDDRSDIDRFLAWLGIPSSSVGPAFALVAGVDYYPNLPSSNRSLKPAGEDLKNLVEFFLHEQHFQEVVLLKNGGVTSQNFKKYLQNYFPRKLQRRENANARFVFAFSGHGFEQEEFGYLLSPDAEALSPEYGIDLDVIKAYYKRITRSAHQSLLLINACNSGDFLNLDPFGTIVPSKSGHWGITSSSSVNELAWHDSKFGSGSIFFEALLRATKGHADTNSFKLARSGRDGIVVVDELYTYIKNQVESATNEAQSPKKGALTNENGSFFFITQDYENIPALDDSVITGDSEKESFGLCIDGADCLKEAKDYASKGDAAKTLELLSTACTKNEPEGCYLLARHYPKGSLSYESSMMKSCDLDYQSACFELNQVTQTSTPEPPKPKDYTEPVMIKIKAGSFRMGDLQGTGEDNEKPVRTVRIPTDFEVGKYEVTFDEYDQFANATNRKLPDDEGWGRGQRPVINVNWNDAVNYAEWLSKKSGKRYRLLTEVEWEYVARAGTSTAFSYGNCIHTDQSNYNGTYYDYKNCGAKTGVVRWKTLHVNTLMPNPWGLYHIHGNVWEWVLGCSKDYSRTPNNNSEWLKVGYNSCYRHIRRGGGWGDPAINVRSANRILKYNSKFWTVGFRLARTL